MIKNILLITTFFFAGFTFAQSLQLMDHNDVSIDGTYHTVLDSPANLTLTKFHVKNLSTNTFNYACKVYEISNPTAKDLQVCFGTSCYIGSAGTSGAQILLGSASIAGSAIDSTFKVGPFSFAWLAGDSAVWRVTIYNLSNTTDSSSAIIKWQANGSTEIIEITESSANLKSYPNPASSQLNINYSLKNTDNFNNYIKVYDVVGKEVKTYQLSNTKGKLILNVDDLNAGVYFYTIFTNNKALKTQRVIIK